MPNHAPTVTPRQAAEIARLWDPTAHDVTHLRTGENSVWSFQAPGGHILRVTSDVHRTREQLQGELAFVEHLVENGLHAAQSVGAGRWRAFTSSPRPSWRPPVYDVPIGTKTK